MLLSPFEENEGYDAACLIARRAGESGASGSFQGVMCLAVLRINCQRSFLSSDRLRIICLSLESNTQVIPGFGIVGLNAERLLVVGDRGLKLILLLEGMGKVAVRLSVARLLGKQLFVNGDRLWQSIEFLQTQCQIVPSININELGLL